ncbi:hypothetical protein AC579_3407 [Pseudocercospora musae]|uniref:Uncharacterized protein n=1 Tax=Pseudocercospora musae TaxID=113226 RepID=A0A139IL72_9PEZI|nr:hypothetical protein AC579_3407 [Pseudocercospora musae]
MQYVSARTHKGQQNQWQDDIEPLDSRGRLPRRSFQETENYTAAYVQVLHGLAHTGWAKHISKRAVQIQSSFSTPFNLKRRLHIMAVGSFGKYIAVTPSSSQKIVEDGNTLGDNPGHDPEDRDDANPGSDSEKRGCRHVLGALENPDADESFRKVLGVLQFGDEREEGDVTGVSEDDVRHALKSGCKADFDCCLDDWIRSRNAYSDHQQPFRSPTKQWYKSHVP